MTARRGTFFRLRPSLAGSEPGGTWKAGVSGGKARLQHRHGLRALFRLDASGAHDLVGQATGANLVLARDDQLAERRDAGRQLHVNEAGRIGEHRRLDRSLGRAGNLLGGVSHTHPIGGTLENLETPSPTKSYL